MRPLRRNLQEFKYAERTGRARMEGSVDYQPTYSAVKTGYANISHAKGDVRTQPFGDYQDYDKTLSNVPDDITEKTVFWIDDLDTSKPHEYEVRLVARTMNVIRVAVKKVTQSHEA